MRSNKVVRFPRLSKRDAALFKDARLMQLVDDCRVIICRHRENRIALGRKFIEIQVQLKRDKGYGEWTIFFNSNFADKYFTIRTATTYMEEARAAKARASENLSEMNGLKVANDKGAQRIRDAEARVKTKLANGAFTLPLRLSPQQTANMRALLAHSLWHEVESKIMSLIAAECRRLAVVKEGANATHQAA